MMTENLILLLETATASCSVALSRNGEVLAVKELNERNVHASHITLLVDEVMRSSGKTYKELSAVAVSKGPGSYTGLRIGVSAAKGFCFALDIPLISVHTLEAMASGLRECGKLGDASLLVPMIDARRMEVYSAVFSSNLELVDEVHAKIVDVGSYDSYENDRLLLFGDGSQKFQELFTEKKNIRFASFVNSAAHMAPIANKKFQAGDFENTAYFEPFYLKDFVATTPKKLI